MEVDDDRPEPKIERLPFPDSLMPTMSAGWRSVQPALSRFSHVVGGIATFFLSAAFAMILFPYLVQHWCPVNRVDDTRMAMKVVAKALEMYRLDNGRYPTTEQGVASLVEKPTTGPIPTKWKKYMAEVPKDAWGNAFVYEQEDRHFRLTSLGRYRRSTSADMMLDSRDL